MRDKQVEETRREPWGVDAAEGDRRGERAVDARLMEMLLGSRARMMTLLAAPREAWARPDHLWAIVSAAEELGVYGLAALAKLTWREMDVWGLQRAGYRSAAIAAYLHIALETAKTHMKRAHAKVATARERWQGRRETG